MNPIPVVPVTAYSRTVAKRSGSVIHYPLPSRLVPVRFGALGLWLLGRMR